MCVSTHLWVWSDLVVFGIFCLKCVWNVFVLILYFVKTDSSKHDIQTWYHVHSHYSDIIMSTMASQINGVSIVYSTVVSWGRSKKISNLRVTDLCVGNSPVTGEFPTQRASNAENVSIWWRHHVTLLFCVGETYLARAIIEGSRSMMPGMYQKFPTCILHKNTPATDSLL